MPVQIHRGMTEFVCPNCGKVFPVLRRDGQTNRGAIGTHLSRCPATIEELAEMVGAKVGSKQQCWLPTSSQSRAKVRGDKHAHLVAYELTYGAIPKGMVICHTCDVWNCINPSHLWLGTVADNVRDMHSKGRSAAQRARAETDRRLQAAGWDE